MSVTYKARNLDNIAKLADHTKAAALHWHDFLVANNIDLLIYETIRSIEEQRANVQKGASQTMKSFHLVGQALDFVPIVNGKSDWNGYNHPDVQKAIAEAKRLGFEWGGDWHDFVDKPHLQFKFNGYGTDTFGKWTEQTPVIHTVVKGDVVSKLAVKYETTVQKIKELNKLDNPNLIHAGKKLRVK